MKGIRKAGILLAAVCMLAASQEEAHAIGFSAEDLSEWSSLSSSVSHPSDELGAVDGSSEGLEYIWELGGKYSKALVVISTDHVVNATDLFRLDVSGFNGTSWISGVFTGKAHKVADTGLDSDDFGLKFSFGSAVSRIGVNSGGTIALSETGAGHGAEFDGVSSVPEPSTFMLLGSGLAALAYIRRRIDL